MSVSNNKSSVRDTCSGCGPVTVPQLASCTSTVQLWHSSGSGATTPAGGVGGGRREGSGESMSSTVVSPTIYCTAR